jgi:hypothetical protein
VQNDVGWASVYTARAVRILFTVSRLCEVAEGGLCESSESKAGIICCLTVIIHLYTLSFINYLEIFNNQQSSESPIFHVSSSVK